MKRNFTLKMMVAAFACCILNMIHVHAQNLEFNWAKSFGSTFMDMSQGIAVDNEGNVYTTGWHNAPADLGNGDLSFTNSGIQVTKHDAEGNFIWAHSIGSGTGSHTRGEGIATDDSGNVYVIGYFNATVDFDPGSGVTELTGGAEGSTYSDIFVLKLTTDGDFVWVAQAGDANNDGFGFAEIGRDIVVDNDHNVYICGDYADNATFGTTVLAGGGGSFDAFVAKLDINGNFVWAKGMTSSFYVNVASGLAIDPIGNIYVTGCFGGAFSVGSFTLTPVGAGSFAVDEYIAKLDSDGNFIWAKSFGNKAWANADCVVDDLGNVYVTGFFSGEADLDPGAGIFNLTAAGTGSDIFVAKLDTDGDLVWANRFGGPRSDAGSSALDIDNMGNVYITATIRDSVVTHGPEYDTVVGMGSNNGDYDILIAKFDQEGNYVWGTNFGNPVMGGGSDEMGYDIAVDASGNVYTTGHFSGLADFDPGPDEFNMDVYSIEGEVNPWDVFILKLGCSPWTDTVTIQRNCGDTTINGQTYSATGIYAQVYTGVFGCDSIITIDLAIAGTLDEIPLITVNVNILSTLQTYASYQWLLNGAPIAGAISQSYTVSVNGDYRVIATNEQGCSDTSEIYTVTNQTGINDAHGIGDKISIYPNPASDLVYINSPLSVDASIYGLDGRILMTKTSAKELSIAALARGIYLLRITDKEGRLVKVEKIVKE